jgi:hypothetical protein
MVVRTKKPLKKKESVVESQKKVIARKPSAKISKAQKFQLDLIARTNFNFFNGKKIVELLKENRRMWRSVYLPLKSISLRDLEDNWWHADMLYIYAEEGWQHSLEKLVREQFHADEIHWIGGSNAADMLGISKLERTSNVILSAWWD